MGGRALEAAGRTARLFTPSRLRLGRALDVWRRLRPHFRARVLGPVFESICRTWTRDFAPPDRFDDRVVSVSRGLVPDAEERCTHEVDVVAMGAHDRVLGIGAAKWGEKMGAADVARLRRVLSLLAARGHDVRAARLLCFGALGFTPELTRTPGADVVPIGLERLYGTRG